jgi:hypothetical protein
MEVENLFDDNLVRVVGDESNIYFLARPMVGGLYVYGKLVGCLSWLKIILCLLRRCVI